MGGGGNEKGVTYRHTEVQSIVAVEFVLALLQCRVNNQLVTPPMVTFLLARSAGLVARRLHAVDPACKP